MHPYVLRFIGCGHGVLFSDPCVDCELVGLHDQYNRAVKTISKIQGRLKELGEPVAFDALKDNYYHGKTPWQQYISEIMVRND
jgi:hypothetical protein